MRAGIRSCCSFSGAPSFLLVEMFFFPLNLRLAFAQSGGEIDHDLEPHTCIKVFKCITAALMCYKPTCSDELPRPAQTVWRTCWSQHLSDFLRNCSGKKNRESKRCYTVIQKAHQHKDLQTQMTQYNCCKTEEKDETAFALGCTGRSW